ncbi:MAG: hypothetical protein LKI39_13470 [Bacteroides sp.]|nr:hypothetical protein [Bacteroides sp.]MCI1683547.1 hypothetical protein [Bacteroides sp.]
MMKAKETFTILIISCTLLSCQSPHENMMKGKYQPTWESLSQYQQAPEWFNR